MKSALLFASAIFYVLLVVVAGQAVSPPGCATIPAYISPGTGTPQGTDVAFCCVPGASLASGNIALEINDSVSTIYRVAIFDATNWNLYQTGGTGSCLNSGCALAQTGVYINVTLPVAAGGGATYVVIQCPTTNSAPCQHNITLLYPFTSTPTFQSSSPCSPSPPSAPSPVPSPSTTGNSPSGGGGGSSGLSGGAIAGIVIGVILGVALIVAIIAVIVLWKQGKIFQANNEPNKVVVLGSGTEVNRGSQAGFSPSGPAPPASTAQF